MPDIHVILRALEAKHEMKPSMIAAIGVVPESKGAPEYVATSGRSDVWRFSFRSLYAAFRAENTQSHDKAVVMQTKKQIEAVGGRQRARCAQERLVAKVPSS